MSVCRTCGVEEQSGRRFVPNPVGSDVEYERYHQLDVRNLSDAQLFRELLRVDHALGEAEDDDARWLLERRAAVVAEFDARGLAVR